MRKFYFRLQKVLEYRELQENWAKDAYLAAKSARIQSETELAHIKARHAQAQKTRTVDLNERRMLETYLAKLLEDICSQQSVIEILAGEEEHARNEWLETKKKKEALLKLREAAEIEWTKAENFQEQKDLDEWSTRRAA